MIALIDGDVLIYTAMWNADVKEQARQNFDELFEAITEELFVDDYAMAVGGSSNFRLDIYSEYKSNRAKSKSTRPEWFHDLKSDITNDYEGCIATDYCEADDMIRIWWHQCDAAGIPAIVVSIDKDLDCISGLHYNPRKQEIYNIEDNLAEFHYWKQILMGDATDNIPGIPGIGPKKAAGLLENSDDYRKTIARAYHDNFGINGYEYLLSNGKLIHILRHDRDYFHFNKEKYNNAISE